MACKRCNSSMFKQKIGRCKTCMWQLTVLSLISWSIWWFLYRDSPQAVNSIALLFFCCTFSGLLCLHLLVFSYNHLMALLNKHSKPT
ncbi:DUF3624 domain-containing protein [Shewanella sp. VB17]|uniref:DUF3624 domain-containing protein n=1 Tax=Shewanella sp. VB17 TaxID=2739432 RepID=UPI0015641A1D|nr:DUF3624 domain-containing protein [Shewanella sp. VB17]NRD74794.1 DUF3624 domain-containing protein [Shewanella sp. VB17]